VPVALVGNSHAGHWRAALALVDDALGWRGVSITRPSCPFMYATVSLPEPLRSQCAQWNRGVIAWFWQHPEVETVFTSDEPTELLPARGQSAREAAVEGYISIWNALPPSVKHIVVIRDNPYNHGTVLECVEEAIAKHLNAGHHCREPRSEALKPDPAAVAARELHSPRIGVIDMTRFFCGARYCYPVVGGALVYRDATHITRVFAVSLGPYLLREVDALIASWRRG
jgi:SGNH domain (fused to AT3 domains)